MHRSLAPPVARGLKPAGNQKMKTIVGFDCCGANEDCQPSQVRKVEDGFQGSARDELRNCGALVLRCWYSDL